MVFPTPDHTTLGKTPQKQVQVEVPAVAAPDISSSYRSRFGIYGYWLGDSEKRYGRLTSSNKIPVHVKLEMLKHPVIAIAQGFITSAFVRAHREIECADEQKKAFFEAMVSVWEVEFWQQASLAVALGSLGFVKRLAFAVPEADPPAWTQTTTPYIAKSLDVLYPVTTTPKFLNDRRTFDGMETPGGRVDVLHSLWLTMNKHLSFGDYRGVGRLDAAYSDWWFQAFGRDLFLVWMQKMLDPNIVVEYPPGEGPDGKSNQDTALAVADSMRSGMSLALSSEPYKMPGAMGEEKMTAVKKWDARFLEAGSRVDEFTKIEDQKDARMALAMLIPPQAFMDVKQSALGGPTTADVLRQLADELLLQDARTVDNHLNLYLFPQIERTNFTPDSPPVTIRTVALDAESKASLAALLDRLLSRADIDWSGLVDLAAVVDRLGFPTHERGPAPDGLDDGLDDSEDLPPGSDDPENEFPFMFQAGDNPPDSVLRAMVEAELPQDGEAAAAISEADIKRAVRNLKRLAKSLPAIKAAIPEAFD